MDKELRAIIVELKEKVVRIDERTEQMVKRMDEYWHMLYNHDKRLEKLEQKVSKHEGFFKIIGGAVVFLVAIITAVIELLKPK